jgi:DnaJ-class molecular chaperone
MTQEDNLYKILEVTPSATTGEIKEAYRRKSMKHHPDRGGNPALFDQVKKAHDVLSDPHKRNRYDLYINVVRVNVDEVFVQQDPSMQDLKFDIKQSMGNVSIKQVK